LSLSSRQKRRRQALPIGLNHRATVGLIDLRSRVNGATAEGESLSVFKNSPKSDSLRAVSALCAPNFFLDLASASSNSGFKSAGSFGDAISAPETTNCRTGGNPFATVDTGISIAPFP
jgi:hypothetical protein